MNTLRALPDTPLKSGNPVAAVALEFGFIEVAKLVVDTSYQRDIGYRGQKQIVHIAENFCWSKFAPLLVAPTGNGHFAIIDGQHRATAAKARGIPTLPALIVPIGREEQAASFAAVNGSVTAISAQQVFKAALAAGEGWAGEITDCAASAGVKVLLYPKPFKVIAPNETMAVGAIRTGIKAHGRLVVSTALRAAMHRPAPGLLNQQVIRALINIASRHVPKIGADAFLAGMARIDLAEESRASGPGAAEAGISRAAYLEASIEDLLKDALRVAA